MSRSQRSVGNSSHQQNAPKSFDILPYPAVRVRVHPVVIFTILDAFLRREKDQENVIGTLLGIVSEGNFVDITDCFVDRHSLTEQGLLQIIKDHHETMFELKQQVSSSSAGGREVVVGWFCTGSEMTELTCAVHGWFKQVNSVSKFFPQPALPDPIHLMVDTFMANGTLGIKAFMQVPMMIAKDSCFQFQELPMEIHTNASDRMGLALLMKARNSKKEAKAGSQGNDVVPPLEDGFELGLEKLLEQLQKCNTYVKGVLDGTEREDTEVGRFLSKTLCGEVVQDVEVYDTMCQNSIQDNLMVAHLSSLARLQFAIAEKLNTSFF